jgi:hypothetical protein
MTVGPDDVHLDFAGGVAAEDGAILNEDDAGPVSGCGKGGAEAGHTTTGNEEVAFEFVGSHGRSAGY